MGGTATPFKRRLRRPLRMVEKGWELPELIRKGGSTGIDRGLPFFTKGNPLELEKGGRVGTVQERNLERPEKACGEFSLTGRGLAEVVLLLTQKK